MMRICPIPVDEMDLDGDELRCDTCAVDLVETYDDDGRHYCEQCCSKLESRLEEEAADYALQHCRITRPFERYDATREQRCSRVDYEMGAKESYSPNAYMTRCRHECTNYDSLIRPLSRDSGRVLDDIFYQAIRERIETLIVEEIRRVNGSATTA